MTIKINNAINSGQELKKTSSVGFGSVELVSGGSLKTGKLDTSNIKIQAYDVDGDAYQDMLTFTAGDTPTMVASADLDFVAGDVNIGASIGENDLKIGGADTTVIIPGDFEVQGTTTTVDTENLIVKDKNITLNNGGTTAGTTGAGLDIQGDSETIVGYMRVDSADNTKFEFKAPGSEFVVGLEPKKNGKTISVKGDLAIGDDSKIDQDLSKESKTAQLDGIKLTGDIDLSECNEEQTNINVTLIDDTADALVFKANSKDLITVDTTETEEGVIVDGYLKLGTDVESVPVVGILNDDTMATASEDTLATSLSVKTYIDAVAGDVFSQSIKDASGDITVASTYNCFLTDKSNGVVTLTLPEECEVGKIIEVTDIGGGGWKIAQNATQKIRFGSLISATGTSGYLASTDINESVTLRCIVEDKEFIVINSIGNLEINV